MNKLKIILIILFINPFTLFGKRIRIVVPYVGSIHNQLLIKNINDDLNDSALMEGLYYQCITPEQYQWNVFFYHAKDLNSSILIGNHFIFDYYIYANKRGKTTLGLGFDFIRIKTDDKSLAGVRDFQMTNHIYAPYFRAGQYFNFGNNKNRFQLFPWVGYECDMLRGKLSFLIPSMGPNMPESPFNQNLDKDYHYGLLGITLNGVFYHFLEIKLKVHKKIDLNQDRTLNYITAMTNIYVSRKWGISYRFKSMDEVIGDNQYHLIGIAYIF